MCNPEAVLFIGWPKSFNYQSKILPKILTSNLPSALQSIRVLHNSQSGIDQSCDQSSFAYILFVIPRIDNFASGFCILIQDVGRLMSRNFKQTIRKVQKVYHRIAKIRAKRFGRIGQLCIDLVQSNLVEINSPSISSLLQFIAKTDFSNFLGKENILNWNFFCFLPMGTPIWLLIKKTKNSPITLFEVLPLKNGPIPASFSVCFRLFNW